MHRALVHYCRIRHTDFYSGWLKNLQNLQTYLDTTKIHTYKQLLNFHTHRKNLKFLLTKSPTLLIPTFFRGRPCRRVSYCVLLPIRGSRPFGRTHECVAHFVARPVRVFAPQIGRAGGVGAGDGVRREVDGGRVSEQNYSINTFPCHALIERLIHLDPTPAFPAENHLSYFFTRWTDTGKNMRWQCVFDHSVKVASKYEESCK